MFLWNVCLCMCASTWSTNSGLDASLLQYRNSVDCTLNMLHENVPVQVKQAERKLVRDLEYKKQIHNFRIFCKVKSRNVGKELVRHIVQTQL